MKPSPIRSGRRSASNFLEFTRTLQSRLLYPRIKRIDFSHPPSPVKHNFYKAFGAPCFRDRANTLWSFTLSAVPPHARCDWACHVLQKPWFTSDQVWGLPVEFLQEVCPRRYTLLPCGYCLSRPDTATPCGCFQQNRIRMYDLWAQLCVCCLHCLCACASIVRPFSPGIFEGVVGPFS